jgi:hypothetical protein
MESVWEADRIAMSQVFELRKNKIFSLKEAKEIFPVVKRVTSEAIEQVERLKAHIERIAPEPSHRPKYEDELGKIVNRWSQKIVKLGCEPKGLWLVDIDNGQGYFCWKYPEEELGYFHTYEGTFAGRTPIL